MQWIYCLSLRCIRHAQALYELVARHEMDHALGALDEEGLNPVVSKRHELV